MSTLHTVNKSPFEKRSLEQCLSRASGGSSLLLIEDAVVAAAANTEFAELLAGAVNNNIDLYVLAPDMEARGFGGTQLLAGINKVDYSGFVDLVTRHDKVHSWT